MRPTAAQVQGALKGACQDFANEHGGVADARADEAEQARVRMLLSDLSMSELQAQAGHEVGEGVLAKLESGTDEQQRRETLTDAMVQRVPCSRYRATAVLIRGGPVSMVEVRLGLNAS